MEQERRRIARCRGRRAALAVAFAVTLTLGVAPAAGAQTAKPVARTGGTADVTQTSVTLLGTVDPNGAATTYYFEIGPTRQYGSTTAVSPAGRGSRPVAVRAAVTGLTPGARYHYRLVARNRRGVVSGANRSFRAAPQPLAFSVAATPNPAPLGAPVTLAGNLTGTGGTGRAVILQARPFPYAQDFVTAGNALLTGPGGAFAFPIVSVPVTTQYRVLLADGSVVSPVVTVGVWLRVSVRVVVRRAARRRGRTPVRFSGTVRPALARIDIQRRVRGRWRNVGTTVSRPAGVGVSRYAKRLRLRRGGLFRVAALSADGAYVSNTSRWFRIRVRRR